LVVLVSVVLHRRRKELSQKVIIGRLVKGQFPDVVEVDGKLLRVPLDQFRDRRRLLLLADLFVFLLVGRGLETLPRQSSAKEVEEDMAEGLQVVSAGLFCLLAGRERSFP
jgi:hypothetical protein